MKIWTRWHKSCLIKNALWNFNVVKGEAKKNKNKKQKMNKKMLKKGKHWYHIVCMQYTTHIHWVQHRCLSHHHQYCQSSSLSSILSLSIVFVVYAVLVVIVASASNSFRQSQSTNGRTHAICSPCTHHIINKRRCVVVFLSFRLTFA